MSDVHEYLRKAEKWEEFLKVRAEMLYEFNCVGLDIKEILDTINLERDEALMIIAHMIQQKNCDRFLKYMVRRAEESCIKEEDKQDILNETKDLLERFCSILIKIEEKK